MGVQDFCDGSHYDRCVRFLDAKPGEVREYSSLAAGLAGELVDTVTALHALVTRRA